MLPIPYVLLYVSILGSRTKHHHHHSPFFLFFFLPFLFILSFINYLFIITTHLLPSLTSLLSSSLLLLLFSLFILIFSHWIPFPFSFSLCPSTFHNLYIFNSFLSSNLPSSPKHLSLLNSQYIYIYKPLHLMINE